MARGFASDSTKERAEIAGNSREPSEHLGIFRQERQRQLWHLESLHSLPDAAQFILNVTASSAATTLDVYLQWSSDAGTTWWDFAHFTQVGAVSTSQQALLWTRRDNDGAAGTGVIVTGDAALAAAKVLNGPTLSNYFRAKWVIAGTSYTFSLIAVLDRD